MENDKIYVGQQGVYLRFNKENKANTQELREDLLAIRILEMDEEKGYAIAPGPQDVIAPFSALLPASSFEKRFSSMKEAGAHVVAEFGSKLNELVGVGRQNA